METRENILNKRILEFDAEIKTDVKVTELNIRDKALTATSLKIKWFRIYMSEKKFLDKLYDTKKIKGDEYVATHGKIGIPRVKTVFESANSDEIKRIELAIAEQDDIVNYLSGIVDILKSLNWDIRNIIDIMKIENC